jgi:hypothetical protein
MQSLTRAHMRRALEAHMTQLGYSRVRVRRGTPAAEIARMSPVRGRLAYGETVVHADLRRRRCHERLLFFSQRRTRQRASILFFIGVAEPDQRAMETLLGQLGIRNGVRGGHVQIVPIAMRGRQRRVPGEAVLSPARTQDYRVERA